MNGKLMPRPTLFDHPKFHRLVYILKLPEPQVLGLLEFLWRVGYSSGNPVIGDELDVEIAAKWWGDPGVFVAAVTEARLVDKRDDGRYEIHDLHENAPTYVKDRKRKETERKEKRRGMSGASPGQSGTNPEKSLTPAPAPAPAPAPERKRKISAVPAGALAGFEQFWSSYPRKVKKPQALAAWAKLAPDAALVATILATLTWQRDLDEWQEENGRFVPHPASWLSGRRWEDERPANSADREPQPGEPDYPRRKMVPCHNPQCPLDPEIRAHWEGDPCPGGMQ